MLILLGIQYLKRCDEYRPRSQDSVCSNPMLLEVWMEYGHLGKSNRREIVSCYSFVSTAFNKTQNAGSVCMYINIGLLVSVV